MIVSWQHKGLQKFFKTGIKTGIRPEHAKRLKIILQFLNAATKANDLDLPEMNFHTLKGNLKDFFAVSVSGNWIVIFQFSSGDATKVDCIDYH